MKMEWKKKEKNLTNFFVSGTGICKKNDDDDDDDFDDKLKYMF